MGHRCCSKQKIKRGLWSPEEDEKLIRHINTHGHKSWSTVPKFAGLQRCGKSCRLRWINYLRPDLKRGSFTAEEEQIIIDIHRILGNRWAQIAKHLPGRTDNEVKNFWNSCIKKKLLSQGLDPQTHNLLSSHKRSSSACANISNNIHQIQNSNSIFILSQHIPNADTNIETSSQTCFSSLPKAPTHILQTDPSTNIVSPEYQLSSTVLSNKFSDVPHELLTENTSNICSHSCMNHSEVEMSNNNNDNSSVWVSRVDDADQDFGVSTLEEGAQVQVQVQQENDKICDEKGIDVREVNDNKGNLEMNNVSFENSNFDFGLLESVLASEFMSHDLNYMDDLAWNF